MQPYNPNAMRPPQFNPNGLYDPQGSFQRNNTEFVHKNIIGTEEIRDIVEKLNAKPFDENLTLVAFDDLTGYGFSGYYP